MSAPVIHMYDENRFFQSSVAAQAHPREPDTWLTEVIDGTLLPLPAVVPQQHSLRLSENGGMWEFVEDHRGRKGWLNGQPYTVKTWGPLPEGWSETAPPPALKEVHMGVVSTINTALKTAIAPFMAAESPSAIATYSEQRMEAEAYTADNTAPTPMLDSLAAARGIEKADLARRVLEKHALNKQASGLLLGQQQALMDSIKTIMSDTRLSDAEKITALEHLDTTVALPAQFTEMCLAAIRESMSAAAAGSAQKPTLFAKLKQVFSNKE